MEYTPLLKTSPNADPTSVKDYESIGGYLGLKRALTLSDKGIIDELKASALIGRGGAGFPTGQKWELVYREPEPVKYVICNADEGETGAFKDRKLLSVAPLRVIEGMTVAGYLLKASRGYLYLRGEYRSLLPMLEQALENARRAHYLGSSILGRFDFDISIVSGAASYLCGEETAMLNSIEGKRGEPRERPPYPTSRGLYGKPTLLNNTETFANVSRVFAEGAKEYNRHVTKLVSLSGQVKHRGVFEVELGSVTLKQLIFSNEFGGGTMSDKNIAFYQVGGQSAAIGFAEQIYTPFDYPDMKLVGLSIGCGAIVVAQEGESLPDYCKNAVEFFMHESCGLCTPCRVGTAQVYALLTQMCSGNGKSGDVERLETLCNAVTRLSHCGLGKAACATVLSALSYRRADFLALEHREVSDRA